MKPLFVLPFDHRSSFAKTLLGFDYPTTALQARRVKHMKQVVFDAFLLARKQLDNPGNLAILVDEEFGSSILKKARKANIPFALTTEKSGHPLYHFEYGNAFGKHLKKFRPTFAKALVRYNPSQTVKNKEQLARLKKLSTFCKKEGMGFMFELLVDGKGAQVDLMARSLKQIIKAGIEPTLWKLEGLDTQASWKKLDGITKTDIIVLGRGESKKAVDHWISTAAKSGIPDGFAIGRTIFFKQLEQYRDKKATRAQAVEKIAKNYLHYIKLWEKNTKKRGR